MYHMAWTAVVVGAVVVVVCHMVLTAQAGLVGAGAYHTALTAQAAAVAEVAGSAAHPAAQTCHCHS